MTNIDILLDIIETRIAEVNNSKLSHPKERVIELDMVQREILIMKHNSQYPIS